MGCYTFYRISPGISEIDDYPNVRRTVKDRPFVDDLKHTGPGRHSLFSRLPSLLVICFSACCVSSSFPSRLFLSPTLLCLHRIHPGFQGLKEAILSFSFGLTAGYRCSEKVIKAAFRKMFPGTGSVSLQLLCVCQETCPALCIARVVASS